MDDRTPVTEMPNPARRRALVVDDDRLILALSEDLLGEAGFQVETLSEPSRTLSTAKRFDPHVLVIDCNMPVLSGREVLRSLRSFPDTAGIPVCLMSATIDDRERLRLIRSGAVDVLGKPLDGTLGLRLHAILDGLAKGPPMRPDSPERIARALIEHFGREHRNGTLAVNEGTPFEGFASFNVGGLIDAGYGPLKGQAALVELLQLDEADFTFHDGVVEWGRHRDSSPRASVTRPALEAVRATPKETFTPRVLVVDDEADLRRLFRRQLEGAGMEVEEAGDGQDALDLLAQRDFDAVIADLDMPRLDGWGMLRRMRADHRTREIPVLFLSAHDDFRQTLEAARAGAYDYLSKTGRSPEVIDRTRSAVAGRTGFADALAVGGAPVPFAGKYVGVRWILQRLGALAASGILDASDAWGRYFVTLRNGAPVDAAASWPTRRATGIAAIAALLVAKNPSGSFTPGPVTSKAQIDLEMTELLERTTNMLNELEERVTEGRLDALGAFEVDPSLYQLLRRVGSDAALGVGRALCEEKIPVEALPSHLSLSEAEVRSGFRELILRGVVRLT